MNDPKPSAHLQHTSPEIDAMLVELTRKMPPWRRAQQLSELILAHRVLILADLRQRYPRAGAEELRKRMAARILPLEMVRKVFSWDPEIEGY